MSFSNTRKSKKSDQPTWETSPLPQRDGQPTMYSVNIPDIQPMYTYNPSSTIPAFRDPFEYIQDPLRVQTAISLSQGAQPQPPQMYQSLPNSKPVSYPQQRPLQLQQPVGRLSPPQPQPQQQQQRLDQNRANNQRTVLKENTDISVGGRIVSRATPPATAAPPAQQQQQQNVQVASRQRSPPRRVHQQPPPPFSDQLQEQRHHGAPPPQFHSSSRGQQMYGSAPPYRQPAYEQRGRGHGRAPPTYASASSQTQYKRNYAAYPPQQRTFRRGSGERYNAGPTRHRNSTSAADRSATITVYHPKTGLPWSVKASRISHTAAPVNSTEEKLMLCIENMMPEGCSKGYECPSVHVKSVECLWEAIEPKAPTDEKGAYEKGFEILAYDPTMTKFYKIPSEFIQPTAGSKRFISVYNEFGEFFKEKFKVCPAMAEKGKCPLGDECCDVHCTKKKLDEFEPQSIHISKEVEDNSQSRLPASVTVRVYEQNSNTEYKDYNGQQVLQTLGSERYMSAYERNRNHVPRKQMQHCAHFRIRGVCRLGKDCNFVHVVLPHHEGQEEHSDEEDEEKAASSTDAPEYSAKSSANVSAMDNSVRANTSVNQVVNQRRSVKQDSMTSIEENNNSVQITNILGSGTSTAGDASDSEHGSKKGTADAKVVGEKAKASSPAPSNASSVRI